MLGDLITEPGMEVKEWPVHREQVCTLSHSAICAGSLRQRGPLHSPPGKPWSWQQPEISSEAAWLCRTCGSTSDGHQLSRPEQIGGSRSRLQNTSGENVSKCHQASTRPPCFFSLLHRPMGNVLGEESAM